MSTSQAVDTFWVQLIESGLVPERQVKTLARRLSREGVSSDSVAARKLVQMGLITRYQASRLLEGRSRGFFFDHYKLLDLLGVGGMGWVYRASHTETGEIVALKVLLDQFKNDHGMLARFEQECRAGLRFEHENIVKTHYSGVAGGLPYVIMEFVEGPSLLELLRMRDGTRLQWEQACDIARQAAKGLHCIHQAGFVHRDIKPQNLLIDHAGHVKLIDFGLSMKHEGESGDEFSMAMIFGHECVGTAAYTAPEQANDSLKADARSDVYSLGCTLFATMTGDTPFPYKKPQDVLKAHEVEVARNVCDIVPTIPRAVGDIVAKMLMKKPEDRYATAEDAAHDLTVWCRRPTVEFDFAKILAERNKSATEKLLEIQKSQKSSSGAASSTANPAKISSVASGSPNESPISSLQSSASSIAKRDSMVYEHQPAISLRQSMTKDLQGDLYADEARDSGMFLTPISSGAPIRLVKSHFLIGRNPECDLQVQDTAVSGQHCELRFDGFEWSIKDLRSRNGIRVNGEIVKKQILERGDTIVVGSSLRLRFGDLRPVKSRSLFRLFLNIVLAMILTALTVGLVAAGYYWYLRQGR